MVRLFGDPNLQDQIQEWLDLQSLEEILDYNDLTTIECVEILLRYGHIEWPEFLQLDEVNDSEE
jgi:hypothetical protein